MELGQKLKESRTKASLSQGTVAQKIGVSRQTISNWENSRSYPDIGSLLKLSDLYGLSLDEMLKADQAIPAHFENLAARRRKLCQILLEAGILLELFGVLMLGQDFQVSGLTMNAVGTVLAYIAIIGHLQYFDHTKKEILRGIAGLVIQLSCTVLLLLWPELTGDWLFRLLHLAGIALIWQSGVWGMFWKSPRVWVYLALYIAVPLFTLLTHLQSAGSFSEANPFPHDYRVAQVLYSEDGTGGEGVKVHLTSVLEMEYKLSISQNGSDRQQIGKFTYTEPIPGQSEKSIWQLIPAEDPDALYRVTVEADDSVTLSYTEDGQLQYKWLLSRVDTAFIGIATIGKTISLRPSWYPSGSPDPEPYLKEASVVRTATLNLGVGGLESEELPLIEEYHHGDSVEYQTYILTPNEKGSYSMELSTRYDGNQEYALYRIPFADGEYRFTLTYGF